MDYTRLYTGTDGQSHFELHSFELDDAPIGLASQIPGTEGVIIGAIKEPNEIPWHNAPRRQFIIMLKGMMEVEIGSGEKKIFRAGDILLAEDLTGQGHMTRSIDGLEQQYLALPLTP